MSVGDVLAVIVAAELTLLLSIVLMKLSVLRVEFLNTRRLQPESHPSPNAPPAGDHDGDDGGKLMTAGERLPSRVTATFSDLDGRTGKFAQLVGAVSRWRGRL